jgi:membrane-bound serine protease (ClpP class)
VIRRLLLACVCAGTLAVGMPAHAQTVYRVPVTGTIELGVAPYVERALREASRAGAAAVILDIDTPGGRVDAALRIVKAITESEVPVYAYVSHWALSAGAMIALAADSIYMRPASSIGAATPVTGGGEKAPEKIVSAMRSEFRALAERRGLDPRIAEAMVDEEIAIEGVIEAGKLLTLTAPEAVELGVAAAEVEGQGDLLLRHGLHNADVVTVGINWAESLVRFLSNPLVAPLLLSLGTLGLIIEIKTPSFGLAGAVGLVSLAAFFGSHLIVGLAGWEELILLGVGLIALAIEVFIVPGFGVAGVVALVCIAAATFLAMLGSFSGWGDIAMASGVLAVTAAIIASAVFLLVRHMPTSRRWAGVFLSGTTDKALGYIAGDTRSELVGTEGVALTDLRPSGSARFGDQRVDVVAEVGFVTKGQRVKVIRAEAYRLVVDAIDAE